MIVKRYSRLLFIVIVITACIVRFIFFTGVTHSVDWNYSSTAYNFAQGMYSIPRLLFELVLPNVLNGGAYLRSGFFYPIALIYYLFGVTEVSAIIYPLLTSVGNILLIYYLGKLIGSPKTGLLAALLLSVYPIEAIQATQLVPDIVSTFYITVAVFLFFKGEHSTNTRYSSIYYYFCGFFTGISYLVKEMGIYVIPLIVVYSLVNRKKMKVLLLYFALGLATVILAEALFYYAFTGDPLFRYHFITGEALAYKRGAISQVLGSDQKYFTRWILSLKGFIDIFLNPMSFRHGLYFHLAIIASPYLWLKKTASFSRIFLWLIISMFFIVYMGYATGDIITRYTIYIAIPATLLIALFCSKTQLSILYKGTIIMLLIATSLLSLLAYRARNTPVYNAKAGITYLARHDIKKPLLTDYRTQRMIQHLSGYKDIYNVQVYSQEEDFQTSCDCYVLINWEILHSGNYADPLPIFYDPPSSWEAVHTIRNPAHGFGIWTGLKNFWAILLGETTSPSRITTDGHRLENHIDYKKDAVIYYVP